MRRLKEEYKGQILTVKIPGMGNVKIDTDKIGSDKSFYIVSGLGYLFEEEGEQIEIIEEELEEIEIVKDDEGEHIEEEVIDLHVEEEKVEEEAPVIVKKNKGGRPKKNVGEIPMKK